MKQKVTPEDTKKRWVNAAAKVPQETKRRILLLRARGLVIGQIANKEKLDMMVVCEIISQSIGVELYRPNYPKE
jgi:hypothetical protein